MEWVESLRGKTVGLDTAPLIYFIEQHPVNAPKLRPFFAAAAKQELRIVTSTVTLLEVLIHPLRNGRDDLAREYRDIMLRSRGMTTLPVGEEIAEEAARLRAAHGLKTADAIQLATAITAGAACFPNDVQFPALPGISQIVIDRLPTP